MAQYIDKNALVAEIERRRDLHYKYYIKNGAGSIAECKYDEDREILSLIDTIEVKEVDLSEEIDVYLQKHKNGYNDLFICKEEDFSFIAKHFFELGMQQSNNGNNNEEKS